MLHSEPLHLTEDTTMTRDLMKTASFAALHFTVAFGVAYALTGSLAIAAGIGLVEPVVNTIAFYFHERAWNRIEPQARVVVGHTCAGRA